MALRPLIGGGLYDRYGRYAWLCIGSMAMYLVATVIAVLFALARRPRARDELKPAVQP